MSLFLQVSVATMIRQEGPVSLAVLALLLFFSVLSWAIIFTKWRSLQQAREANSSFLRAFRKATGLDQVAIASEQFRPAPLVAVFEHGYGEVDRQVRSKGRLVNKLAVERTLQIGISSEVSRLEQHLNWLATAATVAPFIGLFGTVWGIIDAFQQLGSAGSSTLRAVAPGISAALVATAMGLAAAIPAAIAYNYFGHVVREQTGRMEDFTLEFQNLAEQRFEG